MIQTLKRMLAVGVLVFGCMVVANAHEGCDDHKGKAAATRAEHIHRHAELAPREVKRTLTKLEVKSHALEVAPALDDREDESKAGGNTCLRAACSCTSSNHNNPYCRATGGDCANHPGLLCIW